MSYKNYLETEVQSADPVQLVRMLYQGALDAVGSARTCIQGSDIRGRSRSISKATEILNELLLSLDHSKGGELSKSLAELYDYMIRRLNEANFRQIEGPLEEVQRLLQALLEAWAQCAPPASQAVGVAGDGTHSEGPADYQPLSCTA